MTERRLLLMDASVLIDYAESDLSILATVTRHLATLHVLDVVLNEVDQLSRRDCRSVGIEIIEAEVEQFDEAGLPRPGLSFRDRLCLIVANALGLEIVTNDKALRRHCESEAIPVV